MMIKEFQSDGGADFKKKWAAFKARITNQLRSSASRKKKEHATEEAKRIEQEAEALRSKRAELDAKIEAAEKERETAGATEGMTLRGNRKRSSVEISLIKEKSDLEKEVKKRRKASEAELKAAEEAEEEAKELDRLAKEAERSKAKVQAKKAIVTLVDLTGDSNADDDSDEKAVAPTRDATVDKKETKCVAPNRGFHGKACHLAHLLIALRLFVTELVVQEKMDIDLNAYKEDEDAALAATVLTTAEEALQTIGKAIKGKKAIKPEDIMKKLTAEILQPVLLRFANEGGVKEETYVNAFVRRSIVRLGLIDYKEFCAEDSKQPIMKKVLPRMVICSLKSWMDDYTDQKKLHSILLILEQLEIADKLKELKKHIKSSFNCSEKALVVSMVDLITKKTGIEKKACWTRKAEATK